MLNQLSLWALSPRLSALGKRMIETDRMSTIPFLFLHSLGPLRWAPSWSPLQERETLGDQGAHSYGPKGKEKERLTGITKSLRERSVDTGLKPSQRLIALALGIITRSTIPVLIDRVSSFSFNKWLLFLFSIAICWRKKKTDLSQESFPWQRLS